MRRGGRAGEREGQGRAGEGEAPPRGLRSGWVSVSRVRLFVCYRCAMAFLVLRRRQGPLHLPLRVGGHPVATPQSASSTLSFAITADSRDRRGPISIGAFRPGLRTSVSLIPPTLPGPPPSRHDEPSKLSIQLFSSSVSSDSRPSHSMPSSNVTFRFCPAELTACGWYVRSVPPAPPSLPAAPNAPGTPQTARPGKRDP